MALPESAWNPTELLERLEGDHEFLHELLMLFRADNQANLSDSQKALAAGDLDAPSRLLLERILQRAGYEVCSAKNGIEALTELDKEDCPRLALLDWIVPE